MGPKYVPRDNPHLALGRQRTRGMHQFDEPEKVFTCCAFFRHKRRTREQLPGKALQVPTGRIPHCDTCKESGTTFECISTACAHAKPAMSHAFETLGETALHRNGTGWNEPWDE